MSNKQLCIPGLDIPSLPYQPKHDKPSCLEDRIVSLESRVTLLEAEGVLLSSHDGDTDHA